MEEIVNKVASSGLLTFDLEEYYDHAEKKGIDLKEFLHCLQHKLSEIEISVKMRNSCG